jgi:hypothetical protein
VNARTKRGSSPFNWKLDESAPADAVPASKPRGSAGARALPSSALAARILSNRWGNPYLKPRPPKPERA